MERVKKVAFIMIDGLGDRSLPQLNYQTPLQHVHTPNMDELSKWGVNGLMDPVEPGLACGSDTAHMSIFGYDPRKFYKGRGSFETMGAGLQMKDGDIAFKSNFATYDPESGIVLQRRADRNFENLGPELCEYLTNHIKLPNFPSYEVTVQYATEHRCGVRVRGPNLSSDITGTDPLKDQLPLMRCEPNEPENQSAIITSKLVNELSDHIHDLLKKHPINIKRSQEGKPLANIVLLRGCGIRIQVPTFEQKHKYKPFMIAPTAIIAGLGMTLEIPVIKVDGATGDYHTNLHAKRNAFIAHIKKKEYTFGFLHIKAVDDAGHDGNIEMKLKFLENIDKMLGHIIEALKQDSNEIDYCLCLTGDHTTPLLYGDHSDEPVPFVVCKISQMIPSTRNCEVFVDKVEQFSEIDASKGILGRFCGGEALKIIDKYHLQQ